MNEKSNQLAQMQRAVRKEQKRLIRLLEGAPAERQEAMKPVAENAAWMKVQLDRARELIGEDEMIIEYDNGGGQSGIREHPAFKAYEALWKAYIAGMTKLLDVVPVGSGVGDTAEPDKPENVLELIRSRRALGA